IYVSHYTFNWWREHPETWFVDSQAVISDFGPLQEFDFDAFVRASIAHSRWSNRCRELYPGLRPFSYFSMEWLHYHCLTPADVVGDATTVSEVIPRVRQAVQQIHFLQTHRLNQDLHAFLARMGYPPEKIDPILTRGKIHPGP